MPIIQAAFVPSSSIDWDGDIVMSEASSMSPLKSHSVFEFPALYDVHPSTTSKSDSIRLPLTADVALENSADDLASRRRLHLSSSPLLRSTKYTPMWSNRALANRPPAIKIPSPPTKPLAWMWQCHLCRSRYPLHVTRRCLIDGHYYCCGEGNTSPQRNVKRKKRAQSCSSEFDYAGWQDWGKWKRKVLALSAQANGKAAAVLTGCEGCEFPSQCRYEEKAQEEILMAEKYVDLSENPDEHDQASCLISEESSYINASSNTADNPGLGLKVDVRNKSPVQTDFSSKLAGLGSGGRFYANIYNSLSNTDLASASELEPAANSASKRGLREPQSDLATIEKALKTALAEEKQKQRQMEKRSSAPEMATLLHKSQSHQSLLTDLFESVHERQSSQNDHSPSPHSALASSTGKVKSPTSPESPSLSNIGASRSSARWKKRRSNVTHFEDIALSPPMQSAERMDNLTNLNSASALDLSREFEDLSPSHRPSSWTENVFGRLGRFGSVGEDKT